MGAQTVSAVKGPATATREAVKPAHAKAPANRPSQQEIDANQTLALPAVFGSIPAQASDEGTKPHLLLQRKCAKCTAEDDDELSIHRKPLLSAFSIPDVFLQRKCDACENEDESERPSVQRKPAAPEDLSSINVLLRRKCSACSTEEHDELSHLRRKPSRLGTDAHERQATLSRPEHLVREAMHRSVGQSLALSVRQHMEHAYGVDLGHVRIHTDALANEAAQAVAAQAYTLGQSIYFGPGRYQPHTTVGRELLAHELAHVIQNRRGDASTPSRKRSMQVSMPHDACELEADAAARAVLAGRSFKVRGSGSGTLHRKDLLGTAIEWGKTKVDQAESAVGSGVKEVAEFTGEQLMALVRSVAPGLADIISEGPVNYAKRKVSEALDAHMPDALGGFSLSELGQNIGSWLGEAKDFVKGLAQGEEEACQKFAGFMKKLSDFVGKLIDNPVVNAVTSVFDKATEFVTKALKVVGEPLFDGLKEYVSGAWSALKKVASTVSGWFTTAKNALGDLWTRLMSLLGFDGSSEDGVWSWIKGEAAKVWDGIKAAVQPVIEPLKKVASVIALLTPMGQIHAIIKYGPKVVEVVKWIWQNGLDPEKIRNAPAEIRGMLETVGGDVDGFKGKLQEGTDWLSDKMSSLADAVLDVASKVSGLPLVSFAHQMFDDAREALKTLVKDIKDGAEKAVAAIEDVGKKIADFVAPYKEVISSVILAIASPPMIPVILAGWAWRKLPDCIKSPILDFVLDIAIKAISKIPDVSTFGVLWPLLKPGVLAFLETLRAADKKVKEDVSNKIAKIISGASPEFLIAFVKGFLQGVWEGISDPISAIWTVMEGLDKATQYLLSLAGLDDKAGEGAENANAQPAASTVAAPPSNRQAATATPAPGKTLTAGPATASPAPATASPAPTGTTAAPSPNHHTVTATPSSAHTVTATAAPAAAKSTAAASPATAVAATAPMGGAEHETATPALEPGDMAALKAAAGDAAKAIGPDVDTVKGNFWDAVQEYFNGSSITFDEMVQRLSETWEAAKAKISEGGAWLANQLMTFFKGDGAEAEIGDKVGWLSGTLVFQVVLDAITAGTWTEADSILVGIAKFINWPMEALGEAFKLLKSLGKYLLDGLKSLGSAIKETAAGAFKTVSKAIGSIGEKLLAFGEQMFGKFGSKAAKAETKAAGLLGKEGLGLGEREATKLAEKDTAKALEEKAVAGETKVTGEASAAEAKTPSETGHIESDKLSPSQLHNETQMLSEHPEMMEGTPPHRRAQVGEHEWTENTLPNGECEFCRHSAARVCIQTPELRAQELGKADKRLEDAQKLAQEQTEKAKALRAEAEAHPNLSDAEKKNLEDQASAARQRAAAAQDDARKASEDLKKASKKGRTDQIEDAQRRLDKANSELKAAQNEEGKAADALSAKEKKIQEATSAESRVTTTQERVKTLEKNAERQRELNQTIADMEKKKADILAKNKQMRPPSASKEGKEFAEAEAKLAKAKEDLQAVAEAGTGLTAERRELLRSKTPFNGEGGAERKREWLQKLQQEGHAKGNLYKDYATGEYKSLNKLSPDHLNPVEEIFNYEGFGELGIQDQIEILDLPQNLKPLDRSLNMSKGDEVLENWVGSKKPKAPKMGQTDFDELKTQRDNARQAIQDEIQKRLQRMRGQ